MKRATRNFHFTREDGRIRDIIRGEDVVAAGVSKEQVKHFESTGWVEDVPEKKPAPAAAVVPPKTAKEG